MQAKEIHSIDITQVPSLSIQNNDNDNFFMYTLIIYYLISQLIASNVTFHVKKFINRYHGKLCIFYFTVLCEKNLLVNSN
jgi:hypothetical protein